MPAYRCPHCRHLLQFEDHACPSCAHGLGYDPATDRFAHHDATSGDWRDAGGGALAAEPCANARFGVCNWLVGDLEPSTGGQRMCRACRHNRVIPDLAVAGVLDRWRRIEEAKRRLIRALIMLNLPLDTKNERYDGLAFDFLYDSAAEMGYVPQLLTGHAGGVITLNVIEADDVARERIRHQMGEPYRTLLGHFRHEVGHHYWFRLVAGTDWHEPFRALFGDERADYQAAVQAHYASGAPADWHDQHISAYAAAHPWEDFAETFAHYLHIVDTLAAIGSFGGELDGSDIEVAVDFDPYHADAATLGARWIPFSFALNAINRAMGQPDLYPFRLTPGVMLKLDFVARLVAQAGGRAAPEETSDLEAMIATLGHGV
ncbi:MAG: putative zinc-binding metallopeptidase [Sphingomonadaceae bacterium]|nr:putative zinc-binding metallopeptidase [Sphingomonadaceae bacterium]